VVVLPLAVAAIILITALAQAVYLLQVPAMLQPLAAMAPLEVERHLVPALVLAAVESRQLTAQAMELPVAKALASRKTAPSTSCNQAAAVLQDLQAAQAVTAPAGATVVAVALHHQQQQLAQVVTVLFLVVVAVAVVPA